MLLGGANAGGAGGAAKGIAGSFLPVIAVVAGIIGAIWAFMKVAIPAKVPGLPELEWHGLLHIDGQCLSLFPLAQHRAQASEVTAAPALGGFTVERCVEIDLSHVPSRVVEFLLPGKLMRKWQNPGAFDLHLSLHPKAPTLSMSIGTENKDTPAEVLHAFRVGETD